ncbi:hypothetical protein ACMC56_08785 [Campylobacterota bacterium DY0563]
MSIIKISPFLFLLLFIVNKIHALDTNTKDINFTDLNAICSINKPGSFVNDTTIQEHTYDSKFSDGYAYFFYKTFYQEDLEYNKRQLPFLVEDTLDTSGTSLLVYDFSTDSTDSSKYTIKYKTFECNCESRDDYGLCKDEQPKTVKIDSDLSATDICSRNGKVYGATGQFSDDDYGNYTFGPNRASSTVYTVTVVRNSANDDVIPFLYSPYGYQAAGNKARYVYQFEQTTQNGLKWEDKFRIDYKDFTCNCPDGYVKDHFGRCVLLDCTPPQIEIKTLDGQSTCETPQICPDGGAQLYGNCDRSCEDIGLTTTNTAPNPFNPTISKRCINTIDCDTFKDSCINKCGTQSNVENYICNSDIGQTECICRDDDIDDIVDNETPDDTTEASDTLLSNKYLKQIKDNALEQTNYLDDIQSLLETNNENDLKREEQLNSIDGKITDLDTNLQQNFNNLLESQDESNGLLEDIKVSNQGILDKITSWFDSLDNIEASPVENEVGDSLSILDNVLNEFGTFKDNLSNQYQQVVDLGNEAKETINGGFTSIFDSHTSDLTTCKQSFQIDFTSIGASSYNIEIDPCYVTSMLRPIFYPMFYIVFTISVFSFAFSLFRGVL